MVRNFRWVHFLCGGICGISLLVVFLGQTSPENAASLLSSPPAGWAIMAAVALGAGLWVD